MTENITVGKGGKSTVGDYKQGMPRRTLETAVSDAITYLDAVIDGTLPPDPGRMQAATSILAFEQRVRERNDG